MGGLTLNIEITLNNWINSLNTTSSLDIRVAPATRTRGEGGLWPPSPLVIINCVNYKINDSYIYTHMESVIYNINSGNIQLLKLLVQVLSSN